jgi:hypothetical protein
MNIATEKQRLSRVRNWRIFSLRGLYQQVRMIQNPKRRAIIQALIEDELMDLGAKTESQRAEERKMWKF